MLLQGEPKLVSLDAYRRLLFGRAIIKYLGLESTCGRTQHIRL